MITKKVSDSRTEQVHIVLPEDINGYSRLFGGRLMAWIDVVAAVVARRHSGREVTTACVDRLEFQAAAYLNTTIVLTGCVTYVGHTSMEVRVDTFAEALSGERQRVNRAYLVMVALDENQKPTTVPPLELESDKERREWEGGIRRSELRKMRSEEHF
jgi:acyl-CoA hydrolase